MLLGVIGFVLAILFLLLIIIYFVSIKIYLTRNGIKNGTAIRCGGRINNITLSFPFFKLIIYNDYLEILHENSKETINYKEIDNILRINGMFSEGIMIESLSISGGKCVLYIPERDEIIQYIRLRIEELKIEK